MNTQDLLDAVTQHESILVTIETKQVGKLKSRLSNLRSRQQIKLAEFADSKRLEYVDIPLTSDQSNNGTLSKVRISLVGKSKKLDGIMDIQPAEDF